MNEKQTEFDDRTEWYCRYAMVLLKEVDSFHGIIHKIYKNADLHDQF